MRVDKKTLTEKLEFKANEEVIYKLPQSGLVTRYDLLLHLNVTTDSTDGGTPAEDGIARLIDNLRIESAGGKVHFAISDGRLLKYMNYVDFRGKVHEDDLPTAAGVTADVYAKYVIYFGFNPIDPFDASVVLPARELRNLQMRLLWKDASALGTGYTINSGDITITQYQFLLEEDETISEFFPYGLVTPIWDSVEKSIDAVKSDLGFQFDFPTGNVIYRTLIMITDSNDNRSNDEVSEFGIIYPRINTTYLRSNWLNEILKDYHDYNLPSKIDGFVCLEMEDLSGYPLGADFSGFEAGEIKLGFTTTKTGGTIRIAYQQVT